MIPRHVQITALVLIAAMFGAGFYMLQLKAREERSGTPSPTRVRSPRRSRGRR
jgi:hypothetical protein